MLIVASGSTSPQERGGVIGKVQAIVLEFPGLTTREIKKQLEREADGYQVSGALNKLKLEGTIEQDRTQRRIRWARAGAAAPPGTAVVAPGLETHCRCGTSILFGSLATEAERARPTCSVFPFARRGAACCAA